MRMKLRYLKPLPAVKRCKKSMKKINFKNSSFIIFLIISLWYALGNFIYWYMYTPIFVSNMDVLHFSQIFIDGYLYLCAPLMTWIMKSFFYIFGRHYYDLQIIIINYLFFLIGLYFIYKIGVELKNKETGNIAMILFALTPSVYGLSRVYGHQDWHIMIAMIVNIYCLIKADDFKNIKWSILYGITVGLGLLIKDAFLPYFFIPWLYMVIRSLIDKVDKNKIQNILITIILGSLISACHYFRLETVKKILNDPIIEQAIGSIFDFENIRVMTIGLSECLLSPPIFILFFICFVWLIFKYKSYKKNVLILWIFIPWLIIFFMPHFKAAEYGLGFVPAMILVISLYISNIKKTNIKKILILFLIFIGILQYFNFSYKICDIVPFNLKFYYKQNKIFYYDYVFINYSIYNIRKKYILSFYRGIKKYKKYNVSLSYLIEDDLQFICSINDFKFNRYYYMVNNDYDIYINIGKDLPSIENILALKKFAGRINKDSSIEQEKQKIEKLKEHIYNNFEVVEEFYILNIPKEENLIQIYKNKRLIDEGN